MPQDLFTGKPATMKVAPDQCCSRRVAKFTIMETNIQAIAATRPLWEVFGVAAASTLPGRKAE